MGSRRAPKRVRQTAAQLPDDLVHIIFSKLDFESKVIAGQVCKKWDQLLKAPIAGARHWAVDYNLDAIVSSQAFATTEQKAIVEGFKDTIGRWLINRAAAIQVVRVSATLSSGQKGVATMHALENHLPLLAGCLAKHANRLELTFHDGSPFASPLLSSSAFLSFLCPMVKSLSLCDLYDPITASQFAAICELSSLEELSIVAEEDLELDGLLEVTSDISKLVNLTTLKLDIWRMSSSAFLTSFCCPMLKRLSLWMFMVPITANQFAAICELSGLQELSIEADLDEEQAGLQEMTSDISKLVNLRVLDLHGNRLLESIPESISCLQKLELMKCTYGSIKEVPSGLARLASLSSLVLKDNAGPLRFPPSLKGLKSLTSVDLEDCGLETFPEVLADLSTLTYLNLSHNHGLDEWPTTLSRLTNLAKLDISCSIIVNLPPHISGLRQLTKLDVHSNKLRSLPEQLSSLQNLRDLQADCNHLATVPVSVLSSLTALTCINLRDQHLEESATLNVSSSLLPILHPGLVELDLWQWRRAWDPLSLCHLTRAMAEIADRTPVPTLKF